MMIIQSLDYYLDPLHVASHFSDQPDFVFLDSSDQENKYGNYAIIAIEPFLKFSFQKGNLCLFPLKQNGEIFSPLTYLDQQKGNLNDPFSMLRALLEKFQLPESPDFSFPHGAAIGYISYDFGAFFEAGISLQQGFETWPEMEWRFYDTLIIFDLGKKSITIVSTGFPFFGREQNQQANQRFSYFVSLLNKIRDKSCDSKTERYSSFGLDQTGYNTMGKRENFPDTISLRSNFDAVSYRKAVQKIKDYITQGDVYQVNLSQQFSGETKERGYDLYRRIRQINRVPYGGYLQFDQREILCFSMEQFLRMEGRRVQTRPIKGTQPRGRNSKEDQLNSRGLLDSEKDRAELLMVVDMERNDLGKVCEYQSIQVDRLFEMERYATVFHLVSTVSGQLRPSFDHLDCLRACFPGGSITGTPKIRATEIIAELEKVRRGVYCGTIGYFGFNKVSDFNIPIRTILKQGPKLWFNAGGGVVADSDPHLEYLETLHKVRSFLNCLEGDNVSPCSLLKERYACGRDHV